MERRARETAPGETTPAPSARMGMFMPTSAPELRGRKNLAMFLERFYTWASVTGCDSALDSEVVIKTSEYFLISTPIGNVIFFYSRSELSGGAARPRRRFHSCIVLRRVAPAPGLARQSRSPSGGRRFALLGGTQFFCSYMKTTLSHQGPRLEGRRPLQAFKESFLR